MLTHMVSLSAAPTWEAIPYTGTKGLYCASIPDDASKFRIIKLCEDLGITIDHRKLHCTLMYCPDAAPSKESVDRCLHGCGGRITFVEYWTGHNDQGYLVAKIVSNDLQDMHERLIQAGAKHTYSPYNPHITLAKDIPMTEALEQRISQVNELLAPQSIRIAFNEQTISDMSD